MKRVNQYKKVVIVHKNSPKVSSTLGSLCAKSKKVENLTADLSVKCAQIAVELKNVKDRCSEILAKVSGKAETLKVITDAITRGVLVVGFVVCMCILSCDMKVGTLNELSHKTDAVNRKYESVTNKLDAAMEKINKANREIDQFYDICTNQLMRVQTMLDDLSNDMEMERKL